MRAKGCPLHGLWPNSCGLSDAHAVLSRTGPQNKTNCVQLVVQDERKIKNLLNSENCRIKLAGRD